MAAAFVSFNEATPADGSDTSLTTGSFTVAAGDTLVALYRYEGAPTGSNGIAFSDTLTLSWSTPTELAGVTNTDFRMCVSYANVSSGTSTAVTAQTTNGHTYRRLHVLRYSGLDATDPLGGAPVTAYGGATSLATADVTLSGAGVIAFLVAKYNLVNNEASGSLTQRSARDFAEEWDRIETSGGTYAAGITFDTTSYETMAIALPLVEVNGTPQTAAPTSDISAGSWSPSTGATLYGVLDEDSPGTDSDYISTTTNSDTAKVKFASVTDPAVSTGHLLRYRIRATSTDQLTAYLYQGTTLVATDTTRAPGPTETTYTLTLSGAEADSITDYSDLRAWFTSGTHGGATSTAAQLPTTTSTASETGYADQNFVNWSNVTADDTSYSTITHPSYDTGTESYVGYAKGFNFSAIPDGSTITGVECIVCAWYDAGTASGVLAQLCSDAGVRGGTNMWSTPAALAATTGSTLTIGGSGQTWGNSLTAAWVKDADFGVAIAIQATSNNTDISVDYITLKIYYTPPAADWRVTWTQLEVPEATAPEVPDWDWTRTPYNTLLRM